MADSREKIVVINRSFWPVYPVIGEALLRFCEGISESHNVSVVMQDHVGIKAKLASEKRGAGVNFYPARAWTDSSSSVMARAFDAVYFMLWVFYVLLRHRPKKVYVSTDPPVLVPFIVMTYSVIFRAKYIYHLQDIHPEAANVVIPVNKWIYRVLQWMDNITLRRAETVITLTKEMASALQQRSGTGARMVVLNNPAVSFESIDLSKPKLPGFSFCGNAGRLQRISLVIEAIERYFSEGGQLSFTFAGGGVFASSLGELAIKYEKVDYLGVVSPTAAAQVNADYEWALLPIENEVTKFAFPSKSSSYVLAGAKILAICGSDTSVSKWVVENSFGVSVEPDVTAVVNAFHKIEKNELDHKVNLVLSDHTKRVMSFDYFVGQLEQLVLN